MRRRIAEAIFLACWGALMAGVLMLMAIGLMILTQEIFRGMK